MVVSAHPLASAIGDAVLRSGGNAVDAAVAIGYALAVVYPEAGNIGGGGFMLIHAPGRGSYTIDFRETAPSAATAGMFIGRESTAVDGSPAAAVPGTVAGFQLALDLHGTKPLAELITPAIALARDGFEVDSGLTEELRVYRESLSRHLSTAEIFFPDGEPLPAGSILKQTDLARTLSRIRESGNDGFYTGLTAELIAQSQMEGGGLITEADLSAYRAVERQPLRWTYRGATIISPSLPSSGGPCLSAMLKMLEPYDLAALGHDNPRTVHLVTEAMKRAFSLRAAWLGDPAFTDVPLTDLLARCKLDLPVDGPMTATPAASLAGYPEDTPPPEGTETTHFAVVDSSGMVAAVTYTVNDLFGNKEVVEGAGFFLNDEMDDFVTSPGKPNIYGLVGGEANHVGPGKRPLSSMAPVIVLRDYAPILVAGARGGPRIISGVLQMILNVVDFGMTPGDAVAAPRYHHQWMPDELRYEPGTFDEETAEALRAAGYVLSETKGTVGQLQVIGRDGAALFGVPDPREGGLAIGY
jgi:gamma-glutamyltranspeptidase/glutathione hydrolase